MNFDSDRIAYLRTEADIYHLDLRRAQMQQAAEGTYVVHLDPPLFDLAPLLEEVPTDVPVRSAAAAEGTMLEWCLKIQRAERQKVRLGTRCGWTTDQINRRPLTDGEIEDHRARLRRADEVVRLQRQLSDVLETTAKSAAAKKAHEELQARYGVGTVQPKPHHSQAPNAPTKRTVRKSK